VWMDEWVLNVPRAHWSSPVLFRFFETRRRAVVLSSSNQAARETHEAACAAEGIPILQRKGGGGTVLLGPGCVVLTLAFEARELYANTSYFHRVNELWIQALEKACGLEDVLAGAGVDERLATRGISDIALGERKVAGTSVFRRKHLFVYQGSLLVHPDLDAVERVLAHPSREPDYRGGRPHREFLTTLKEQGLALNAQEVAQRCSVYFREHAVAHFADCRLS